MYITVDEPKAHSPEEMDFYKQLLSLEPQEDDSIENLQWQLRLALEAVDEIFKERG